MREVREERHQEAGDARASVRFRAERTEDPGAIRRNSMITAADYLSQGKVTPERIQDGVIVEDPSISRASTHYSVYDDDMDVDEPQVVGRLIYMPDKDLDNLRIPTQDMIPSRLDELRKVPPEQIAEIASVVKKKGVSTIAVLSMYREMFRDAIDRDITHLLCAIDPRLHGFYEEIFGWYMEPLSEGAVDYPGFRGGQYLYVIRPHEGYDEYLKRKRNASIKARLVNRCVKEYFINRLDLYREKEHTADPKHVAK